MKDLTAKEKSKELVEKFIHAAGSTCDHDVYCGLPECQWYGRLVCCVDIMKAKQCALIAVDEIFEFMRIDDEYTETASNANSKWVGYYQEVKSEIEKL